MKPQGTLAAANYTFVFVNGTLTLTAQAQCVRISAGNNAYHTDRGVTFSIPAGWATAFVGGSGSGKTTVLQLLQKFYSPTSGRVRNREQEGGDAGRGHQAVGW